MTRNKEATAKGKKEAPCNGNKGRNQEKKNNTEVSLSRTDDRFLMVNPEKLVKSPEGFSGVEVGNDSYTPDRDKNKLIKTTHSDKGESHRLVGGYIKAIREIVNEEGEDPHLLVEFKTRDSEGFQTGVFETLPLESQYRKEALELTRSNKKGVKKSPYELLASPLDHLENYGTLGVEFVKALVSMLNNEVEPQDLCKDIEKHYHQWGSCLISNSASHRRVGKRLALASYAGELAIKEGLFSYTDEDGKRVDVLTQGAFINATQALYKAWAGVFMTEEEKIEEALNEFIGALLSQKNHFMNYTDKGAKRYELQAVNSHDPLFGAIVTLGYGNNEGDKTLFIISQAEIKKTLPRDNGTEV